MAHFRGPSLFLSTFLRSGRPGAPTSLRASHPHEAVPIIPLSLVHLTYEYVAPRIGREAMGVEELPRIVSGVAAHLVNDLQRLSVQDMDPLVGAIDDE